MLKNIFIFRIWIPNVLVVYMIFHTAFFNFIRLYLNKHSNRTNNLWCYAIKLLCMAQPQSVKFAVCFMTCFLSYADDPALESFMNFDGMQSWLQHFVFGSLLVQPTDCMPKPHSQNSVFPSLLHKKKKKRFYGMHATPDTRIPRIVRHVCDF